MLPVRELGAAARDEDGLNCDWDKLGVLPLHKHSRGQDAHLLDRAGLNKDMHGVFLLVEGRERHWHVRGKDRFGVLPGSKTPTHSCLRLGIG